MVEIAEHVFFFFGKTGKLLSFTFTFNDDGIAVSVHKINAKTLLKMEKSNRCSIRDKI